MGIFGQEGDGDMNQDVLAYLDRIGYSGSIDTSLTTLTKLQECHVHTVPWENLDILKKIPLSLAIPDLIDKIIYRKCGGYCFELNALYGRHDVRLLCHTFEK